MVKGYVVLVGAVAVERVVELVISNRHVRRARARGGVEAGASLYPAMVAMHSAFLAACVLEPWLLGRPWIPSLAVPMLVLLGVAFVLRNWSMATLGDRWSTRVICVPGDRLVASGPYRWVRHPNYAAIVIEFVALPLAHAAWLTAAVFSALNAVVLRKRIAIENDALARYCRAPEPR
jgi:methyltransferase